MVAIVAVGSSLEPGLLICHVLCSVESPLGEAMVRDANGVAVPLSTGALLSSQAWCENPLQAGR